MKIEIYIVGIQEEKENIGMNCTVLVTSMTSQKNSKVENCWKCMHVSSLTSNNIEFMA